jgi:predicted RND superfamily exporter protein
MSIGLLFDFIVHIALMFYESKLHGREAKIKEVLRTTGASVLLGGTSTLLDILPLALSSSNIVMTFFITLIGIALLGLSHGLILLPVLLSLIGPD